MRIVRAFAVRIHKVLMKIKGARIYENALGYKFDIDVKICQGQLRIII